MKFDAKKIFLILLGILIIGGFWCLTSASNIVGRDEHSDAFYFVKDQFLKGLVFGLILFFIFSKINLNFLRKFSFVFYIINIGLLCLVFIPMFMSKGHETANRWVQLPGFSFQPAELLKFSLIFWVADFLSRRSSRDLNEWSKTILPLGMALLPTMFLIYKQPATSIICLFIVAIGAMCFATKMSFKVILASIILIALVFGSLILMKNDYRKDRLTNADDYQRRQSITGIVRGGIKGVGFGQSRQKYNYLPQSYTDSIYAVIAEEFGFIGTAMILSIYFWLCFLGFSVAIRLSDSFSSLFIVGTMTWITVQALYHIICMSFNYMPITGLPLPLISYGGTSYAITLANLGVVYNIFKNKL